MVAAVVPWNFPLTLGGWKLAPALAAGCTVVLKTAEQSPLSMQRVADLGVTAGLPPGVFNVLSGDGPVVGRRLGEHPDVDVLTFTGSTDVGRQFMRYSADSNLKRVYLELGGKSPNIIFPTLLIWTRRRPAAWAIFFNSGEMCTAGSRLVVHADVADRWWSGSWTPLLSGSRPIHCFRTPRWAHWSINAAWSACSDISIMVSLKVPHCGSAGHRVLTDTGGAYLEPTVVTGAAPDNPLVREEIFGPVLAVQVVRTKPRRCVLLATRRTVWRRPVDLRSRNSASGIACPAGGDRLGQLL